MLFVYWLGADLGVLIAAIWARSPARSLAERAVLLQIATAIDLTPRLAFALMLPVGFTLAQHWGLALSDAAIGAVWVVALLWLLAIVTMARAPGGSLGRGLARGQFWFLLVAGTALVGWGIALLANGTVVPAWLGWKIVLYGGIFFAAIGIDLAFRPVIPAFGALASQGSTPAIEAAIRRPIDRAMVVVLTLYALLLAISFLGTVKPEIAT